MKFIFTAVCSGLFIYAANIVTGIGLREVAEAFRTTISKKAAITTIRMDRKFIRKETLEADKTAHSSIFNFFRAMFAYQSSYGDTVAGMLVAIVIIAAMFLIFITKGVSPYIGLPLGIYLLDYIKSRVKKDYYRFMNSLLIDLGWKADGVTVGALTSTLVVASLIATSAVSYYVFGLSMFVLVFPVVYLLLTAMMFSVSKSGHDKREEEIRDFEDIMAPVVKDGWERALVDYREALPESVQKGVQAYFLAQAQNKTFQQCMDQLVDYLGESFRDFASKVVVVELNDRKGASDIFKDVVPRNGRIRENNRIKTETFAQKKSELYIKTIMILGFMLLSYQTNQGAAELYQGPIGKLFLYFTAVCLIITYAILQFTQSSLKGRGKN